MLPSATLYPWAHVQTVLYTVGTASAPKSCVYDASAYDGIYFQAIGIANIRLSLEMDLNVPTSNTWGAPGACTAATEADCYDRYGRNILVQYDTRMSAVWSAGTRTYVELPGIGGKVEALGMNEAGDVAG